MKARVALVTGGAGFIGSALVRRLLADDHEVRVVDDASRGSFARLEGLSGRLERVSADVRDAAAWRQAAKDCDWLLHLAAVNGTRFFYEEPRRVLDVAIRGTQAAIENARAGRVRRFLLASSSEVYHDPPVIPTPEDVRLAIPDPYNARFSYAGGKIASELLAIHGFERDTDVVIFRPHNVYGPAMGFEHVIPELVQRIRAGARAAGGVAAEIAAMDGASAVARAKERSGDSRVTLPLTIQGTGEETRSFCFVEDAVEAIVLLAERGETRTTYHVGREQETSIRRLAVLIGEALGFAIDVKVGPAARGTPKRRCPDCTRLKKLGFRAAVELPEGLRRTVPCYWDAPSASAEARS